MNYIIAIIPTVIAVCAILSPIITTKMNNHHQLELKRIELEQQSIEQKESYLKSIYENYFKQTSKCIAYPDEECVKSYGECYSISFVYFPQSAHEQLKEINSAIHNGDQNTATALL